MRRIGIFCGAFDPIHLGHLRILQDLLDRDQVDEILIVPNGAAPYARPIAGMEDIRQMAQIATAGMQKVSVADAALLSSGQDSLGILKAIIKRYPGASFFYIIGADKLAGILHWSKVNKILELCELLVYPRVGFNGQELTLFALAHGFRAKLLPVAPVHISSSLVRTQLRLLSDAPGMLLPEVARHVALRGLYHPPYQQRIKADMNQKRYEHTLGVRKLAVALAYHHGTNMQKAAVAALLHDCAKCMKLSQLQAIARKYHLSDDEAAIRSNALLHGLVGARYAMSKYDIHDEDVLNAIRYHTTGQRHMSPLELVIFVADAAEEGRADYPGLQELRELMWQDLRRAALHALYSTQKHVAEMRQHVSPLTQQAIDDLKRSILRSEAHQTSTQEDFG